jgi:hypothetical protein
MTDANKHLLNYFIYNPNKKRWRYPFAEDPRWSYWAYNTAERHRCNGQKSVFLAQSPEFANMSIQDLEEIVSRLQVMRMTIPRQFAVSLVSGATFPYSLVSLHIWSVVDRFVQFIRFVFGRRRSATFFRNR